MKICLETIVSLSLVAGLVVACGNDVGEEEEAEATGASAAALTVHAPRLQKSKLPLAPAGGAFAIDNADATAEVPATAKTATRVSLKGVPMAMRIVGAKTGSAKATRFNDNTVIYENTDVATSTAMSVAVNDEDTAIEAYTIIASARAPETFRYEIDLEGGETLEQVGPTTAIVSGLTGAIRSVEAPWALDARGEKVPYRMRVEGNTVVLDVFHRGAKLAYPLVVDPVVKFGCGIWNCSATFSREVTKKMGSVSGYLSVAGGFCGAVKYPWACAAFAAAAGAASIKSSECAGKNQCLKVRVFGPPVYAPVPFCVGGKDCWDK